MYYQIKDLIQRYNDNLKRPKLQETQLGILRCRNFT